ncbi:MAG: multicopper oxidase domain-containing protein [Actinomycetia bacterium]|nr:multicopper oxidase domain-containing protein [Actinomycetes bacterium]MCP5031074.1 multicopper oxidase domain-containing protein [Actinomycetes bacterium]
MRNRTEIKMKKRGRVGLGLLGTVGLLAGALAIITTSPVSASAPGTNIVCSAGGVNGAADVVTINLAPTEGYMSTPDGNSLYMWSYGEESEPGAGDATFQTPAPTICVDEGDTVTVNLTVPGGWPTIPTGSGVDTPVSIIFPGQTVTTSGGSPGFLTAEASGGTVSYTFTPTAGTYLYEGGTNSALHVAMGMYGSVVVYPKDGTTAYGPGTEYDTDREFLLMLHSVDPGEHQTMEYWTSADPFSYVPEPYEKVGFTGLLDPPGTIRHERYWTINGRSNPDTLWPNNTPLMPNQPYGSVIHVEAQDPADPGLPALVRYTNASLDNHPFHPHGNSLKLIAQDGQTLGLGDGLEIFTSTVGSGQTYDLMVEWLDVNGFDSTFNPIPVTLPGLNNLVFKDDSSTYSGSPYLGEKGELPAPVTQFNACGEYYFPWHSHALWEIQNFDEGFGGMLTLWRVDPIGGCQ